MMRALEAFILFYFLSQRIALTSKYPVSRSMQQTNLFHPPQYILPCRASFQGYIIGLRPRQSPCSAFCPLGAYRSPRQKCPGFRLLLARSHLDFSAFVRQRALSSWSFALPCSQWVSSNLAPRGVLSKEMKTNNSDKDTFLYGIVREIANMMKS